MQFKFRNPAGIRSNIILLKEYDDAVCVHIIILLVKITADQFRIIGKICGRGVFKPLLCLFFDSAYDRFRESGRIRVKFAKRHRPA